MTRQSGYDLPYINSKALYAAVMYARRMIREEGKPPGIAISRAAGYYNQNTSEVARYVGMVASRVKARKNSRAGGSYG